jgi:hypothetical protein
MVPREEEIEEISSKFKNKRQEEAIETINNKINKRQDEAIAIDKIEEINRVISGRKKIISSINPDRTSTTEENEAKEETGEDIEVAIAAEDGEGTTTTIIITTIIMDKAATGDIDQRIRENKAFQIAKTEIPSGRKSRGTTGTKIAQATITTITTAITTIKTVTIIHDTKTTLQTKYKNKATIPKTTNRSNTKNQHK